MSKYTLIIFVLIYSLNAIAQTINIQKDIWNLVGTSSDINISDINLKSTDLLWKYDTGSWSCNSIAPCATKLTSLSSGDAFWIKSTQDYNMTIADNIGSDKAINSGWTMFSPTTSDINVSEYFNSSEILSIWTYSNGWKLWTPNGLHTSSALQPVTTISVGEGAWVNANSTFLNSYVTFGSDKTALDAGIFSDIEKLNSDSVENIWNISLKSNENISSTNFKFCFSFTKPSSARVDVIIENISIINNLLITPTSMSVYGRNSAGSTKTVIAELNSTLTYSNGTLSINIGTMASSLSDASIKSEFNEIGTYDMKIISSLSNMFNNDYNLTENEIFYLNFTTTTTFDTNSSMIKGKLLIK